MPLPVQESETAVATITEGTIIHGTLLNEDVLPAVFAELERLAPELADKKRDEYDAACQDFDSELAGWLCDEIFDDLSALAPEGYYFGAHIGDGSDFGFWRYEGEAED